MWNPSVETPNPPQKTCDMHKVSFVLYWSLIWCIWQTSSRKIWHSVVPAAPSFWNFLFRYLIQSIAQLTKVGREVVKSLIITNNQAFSYLIKPCDNQTSGRLWPHSTINMEITHVPTHTESDTTWHTLWRLFSERFFPSDFNGPTGDLPVISFEESQPKIQILSLDWLIRVFIDKTSVQTKVDVCTLQKIDS
jgi:hypothetical protein